MPQDPPSRCVLCTHILDWYFNICYQWPLHFLFASYTTGRAVAEADSMQSESSSWSGHNQEAAAKEDAIRKHQLKHVLSVCYLQIFCFTIVVASSASDQLLYHSSQVQVRTAKEQISCYWAYHHLWCNGYRHSCSMGFKPLLSRRLKFRQYVDPDWSINGQNNVNKSWNARDQICLDEKIFELAK